MPLCVLCFTSSRCPTLLGHRFDETGAKQSDVCGSFNKAAAGPISTQWAEQVCTAKEAYEVVLASSANTTLAAVAATEAVGSDTDKADAKAKVLAQSTSHACAWVRGQGRL